MRNKDGSWERQAWLFQEFFNLGIIQQFENLWEGGLLFKVFI